MTPRRRLFLLRLTRLAGKFRWLSRRWKRKQEQVLHCSKPRCLRPIAPSNEPKLSSLASFVRPSARQSAKLPAGWASAGRLPRNSPPRSRKRQPKGALLPAERNAKGGISEKRRQELQPIKNAKRFSSLLVVLRLEWLYRQQEEDMAE